MELRIGLPKTRKLPQSIQSPEGVDLIPSRDGRIRTGDPLNPIQVRYRAAPRPVSPYVTTLYSYTAERPLPKLCQKLLRFRRLARVVLGQTGWTARAIA